MLFILYIYNNVFPWARHQKYELITYFGVPSLFVCFLNICLYLKDFTKGLTATFWRIALVIDNFLLFPTV